MCSRRFSWSLKGCTFAREICGLFALAIRDCSNSALAVPLEAKTRNAKLPLLNPRNMIMNRNSIHWTAMAMLVAHSAHAQAPQEPAAVDTEETVDATASGSIGGAVDSDAEGSVNVATASPTLSPSDVLVVTEQEPPYIERYKPENGTLEVGLFSGLFFPSPGHKLYQVRNNYQKYDFAAVAIGGRLAYFPSRWLGFEGEFMMANGRVPENLNSIRTDLDSHRVTFHAYRAQFIAQLPLWSVTPFVLLGAGGLGTNSQPLGSDTDPSMHAGIGVKVPMNSWFSLRADLGENIHPRFNDRYWAAAFSEELLIGATFTLGRALPRPAAPIPPPADTDRDNVPDTSDVCPNVAALTENGCPADTDGDGIADPDDHCPRDVGIEPDGCPDLDPDNDGVPLPCDQCADEKGMAPDGCPIRDTDGDGLMDDVDACPKEAETKNGYMDDDGCPDEIPREVRAFTGAIEGIQFERGKAKIRTTSEPILQAAAVVLQKFPSIRIEVSGHTSSEGDRAYNQSLSEERAAAVRQWLLDHDVLASRITSRGAGPDEPVSDNATEAGRSKNRRIEFKILTH